MIMFELLEKVILAGVGFANLTKERAEKLVDTMIKKGKIKAKDKKAVLSKLLKGTEKLDRDLEKKMKQVSLSVVKNSQKQIDALNKKLVSLSKALDAEKKKSKPGKAKKTTKKTRTTKKTAGSKVKKKA
jgi:polyhydroxyalkanoate synthesis regulator phasin